MLGCYFQHTPLTFGVKAKPLFIKWLRAKTDFIWKQVRSHLQRIPQALRCECASRMHINT
jgi:hypothetical protein